MGDDVDAASGSGALAELVFGEAPVAMAVCRGDGRLAKVNGRLAELSGRSPGDLEGTPLDAVLVPCEPLEGLLADAGPRSFGARVAGRHVEVHLSALRAGHRVLHVEDVSERRRVEAQLVHAERLASVGTLASSIAHEINNPLTYVMSNVLLVRDELREGTPTDELGAMLDSAIEGAERVHRIVQGLRTFARSETHASAHVDVRRALDTALVLTSAHLQVRARVVRELGSEPLVVEGDETRLVQVFVNLLVNAGDAMCEKRRDANVVRVHASRRGDDVVVEISDSGMGIPEPLRARIFDTFFTTKPPERGTGLGLPVSVAIVRAHGGVLEVDSVEGAGSTFRVVLRAALSPGLARPRALAAEPRGTAAGSGAAGSRS